MRMRMLILMLAVGASGILVFSACVFLMYRSDAEKKVTGEAREYAEGMADVISQSGYMADVTTGDTGTELNTAAEIYEGRVIVVNDSLKVVSDSFSYEVGKTLISKEVVSCIEGTSEGYEHVDRNRQYTQVIVPIISHSTKDDDIMGVIIMQASLADEYEIMVNMHNYVLITAIVVAILTLILSLTSSKHLVRPLKNVAAGIKHAADGFLDEKVSVDGCYEVREISNSFNELLGRINVLENSRQEFVSNVSHELKTPMTSMKVLADSLNMQQDAPVEMYKDFMADITSEIERENKIISDLLSLVKLDRKAGDLNITPTDIGAMLELILKRLKPLAAKGNIELVFESFRPVTADVDEVKLSLAITNLIENSIKYNVEGGNVRVSMNADHRYFYITVADTGIGIPEDCQEKIFDRFYRVDKARSRQTGGTGLGLAITRSVVIMHGGVIKVYSKENEGTTFTVKISLKHSDAKNPAVEQVESKTTTQKVDAKVTTTTTTTIESSAAVKQTVAGRMKKFKNWHFKALFFVLLAAIGINCTACGKKNEVESDYSLYFLNTDGNQVVAEPYVMKSSFREAQIQELINALMQTEPSDSEDEKALPEDVEIEDYSFGAAGQLILNFSPEYSELSGTTEILIRAAIVKTFCQVSGVDYIEFYVNGLSFMIGDTPVGLMKSDDFIDNTGEETFFSQNTYITVFFANGTGDKLIESHRKVGYNGTISLEQLVVEQLIAGPIDDEISNGMQTAMPDDVILNKISTKDGICYVDLSGSFLNGRDGIDNDVIIYSVVDSLTELSEVSRVIFTIDGSSIEQYGDIPFSDFFETNLGILENGT